MKHNINEDNEELQDNEPNESIDEYLHKLNIKHSKIILFLALNKF
mgnify:CR=1 FL=1